jgi:hypothetical protein
MAKEPAFSDAHSEAFQALAAVYALVRLRRVGLSSEVDRRRFREWAARLSEYTVRFADTLWRTRHVLEAAIPTPSCISLCGEHEIYAHDIADRLCYRIVERVKPLADIDQGLERWRERLEVFTNIPTRDELKRLWAELRSEAAKVRAADASVDPPKRRRGRYLTPHDPEADAKAARDWLAAKRSGTKTIADFCRSRGKDEGELRAAIERHRKRQKKRKSRPSGNPRQ